MGTLPESTFQGRVVTLELQLKELASKVPNFPPIIQLAIPILARNQHLLWEDVDELYRFFDEWVDQVCSGPDRSRSFSYASYVPADYPENHPYNSYTVLNTLLRDMSTESVPTGVY